MKHFLTIEDLKDENISDFMKLIAKIKKKRGKEKNKVLKDKVIGMIFSKASTRTRVSFEVGIRELGGTSLFLNHKDLQLGKSETIEDTAKVLSRYLHGMVIRTHGHEELESFTKNSTIPVINALTNEHHPCQALSDTFSIYEITGKLKGIKWAFLGDGASNMANSLIHVSKLAGMELTIAAPERYAPFRNIMEMYLGKGKVKWVKKPEEAVKDADFIYTDTWVSMGFEAESAERLELLRPYQINSELLEKAPKHAKVMHCLPAYRGNEITNEVMDGQSSIIIDQAENRLHTQKAILTKIYS